MLLLFLMCVLIFVLLVIFYILGSLISIKIKYLRSQGSPFECGFDNFLSSRLPFSIHFYLIAILFLVFDIEIVYLVSFVITMKFMSIKLWLFSVMTILLILFLGLEYEKYEGSLKWII